MKFREVEQCDHDQTARTCRGWRKRGRWFDSKTITSLSLFTLLHAAFFRFSLLHPLFSPGVHKNSAHSEVNGHTYQPRVLLKCRFQCSSSGRGQRFCIASQTTLWAAGGWVARISKSHVESLVIYTGQMCHVELHWWTHSDQIRRWWPFSVLHCIRIQGHW